MVTAPVVLDEDAVVLVTPRVPFILTAIAFDVFIITGELLALLRV